MRWLPAAAWVRRKLVAHWAGARCLCGLQPEVLCHWLELLHSGCDLLHCGERGRGPPGRNHQNGHCLQVRLVAEVLPLLLELLRFWNELLHFRHHLVRPVTPSRQEVHWQRPELAALVLAVRLQAQ